MGGEGMNVKKFKEIVSTWDNYQESSRSFRVWAQNCYDNYNLKKMMDRYEEEYVFQSEEDFGDSEEFENFSYTWNYIGFHTLLGLYNCMEWRIDEKYQNMQPRYDEEGECFYYDITFEELYNKVEKIEDDLEYVYAILVLCRGISHSTKLYKEYAKKIYEGLKEYDLEECQELLNDSNLKKVFVAMWFDTSMNLAREKIEQALTDCNYEPMLIDVKEHNGQIVPEIFREIEESEFVVADLTGHRGGVYYEAGYAMAKDKPVILCCEKGTETHFDVAQVNTIYWENEKDLYDRLVKRIKATVGENIC